MRKNRKRTLHRLPPALIASVGAIVGLSFIGLVAQETRSMMIIAPFGATAILLFSLPHSNASKPLSVFSSYLLASVVGLVVLYYSNNDWLYIGVGLGIVLFIMQLLDIVHPPAGAHYIIVTQGSLTFSMIESLFVGLLTLTIFGLLLKKIDLFLQRA